VICKVQQANTTENKDEREWERGRRWSKSERYVIKEGNKCEERTSF
jgi:hypothetical protein